MVHVRLSLIPKTLVLLCILIVLFPTSVLADEQIFESNVETADSEISIYSNIYGAQTFTTLQSHSISRIRLPLFRKDTNGLPGLVTLTVMNGNLSTTLGVTTLNGDAMSEDVSGTWYDFEFTENIALDSQTQYGMVLSAGTGNDTNNSINWRYASTGTETGGERWHSVNGSIGWIEHATEDHLFQVFGETSLVLNSAEVYSSFVEDDDWLLVAHYENIVEPFFSQGTAVEQLFNLQLLVGSNLIANGTFETANSSWTGVRATLAGNTTVVKVGESSGKITTNDAGGAGSSFVYQDIPNFAQYRGSQVSLGAWAYAPSANDQVQLIGVFDGVGNTTTTVTADDTWRWTTAVHSVDANASMLRVAFYSKLGPAVDTDDELYIDNAYLAVGAAMPPDALIGQTPTKLWGSRPGSIYFSPTETASLEWQSSYVVRLWGNYDANPSTTFALRAVDWKGDNLSLLDKWVIGTAKQMGEFDSGDPDQYVTSATNQGEILKTGGEPLFTATIPGLMSVRGDTLMEVHVRQDAEDQESSPIAGLWDMDTQLGPEVIAVADDAGAIFALPKQAFLGIMLVIGAVGMMTFIPLSAMNAGIAIFIILVGIVGLEAGIVPVAYGAIAAFVIYALVMKAWARGF